MANDNAKALFDKAAEIKKDIDDRLDKVANGKLDLSAEVKEKIDSDTAEYQRYVGLARDAENLQNVVPQSQLEMDDGKTGPSNPELEDFRREAIERSQKDAKYKENPVVEDNLRLSILNLAAGKTEGLELGFDGKPVIKVHPEKAKRMAKLKELGYTPKDFLDLRAEDNAKALELAVTTTVGGNAGNAGDAVPTFVDTEWHEIEQTVGGMRRVPGVNMVRTGERVNQTNLPIWNNPALNAIGGDDQARIAGDIKGETADARQAEGYVSDIEMVPQDFSAFAALSEKITRTSNPDIDARVARSLARAVIEATERAMAIGDGMGKPEGIFRAQTANTQIGTANTIDADEILALPGDLEELGVSGEGVYAMHRSIFYNRVLSINTGSSATNPFYFVDPVEGSPGRLYGDNVFLFLYGPKTMSATTYPIIYFYPEAYAIFVDGPVEIRRSEHHLWRSKQMSIMASEWLDGRRVATNAFSSLQGV